MEIERGMTVDECPATGHNHCSQCGHRMAFHALRVCVFYLYDKKYYHFYCFQTYKKRQVVFPEYVEYRDIDTVEVERVRQWIAKCIGDLKLRGRPLHSLPVAKEVGGVLRRPLLEVFQYLSVADIELGASITSRLWHGISLSEELWECVYTRDFKPGLTQHCIPYRVCYLARVLTTCRRCKQLVRISDMELSDPLHIRPICSGCIYAYGGNLLPVKTYCRQTPVEYELLEELGVPFVTKRKVKYAYSRELEPRMQKYSEKRLHTLLSCLESEYASEVSEKIMKYMKKTAENGLRYNFNSGYYGPPKVVAKFVGKRDRKEHLAEEVKELIAEMKVWEEKTTYFN